MKTYRKELWFNTPTHTENYFTSGDKAVELYNAEYSALVEAMRLKLEEADLLKANPALSLVLHQNISSCMPHSLCLPDVGSIFCSP